MTTHKCTKCKQIQIIKLHWTIWLFLILVLAALIIGLIILHQAYELKKNCQIKSEVIGMNDNNIIINDLDIVAYLCDDTVQVDHYITSPKFYYFSTWYDGKVPHSIGQCFIKYRECEVK